MSLSSRFAESVGAIKDKHKRWWFMSRLPETLSIRISCEDALSSQARRRFLRRPPTFVQSEAASIDDSEEQRSSLHIVGALEHV